MERLVDELRARPFELILSSGFFGFFAHAGVVAALEEARLRPAGAGGSSAGALVAGLWCAGVPATEMRERLFALRREDFWDPDPLFGLPARRPGLLRGGRFAALLDEILAPVGVARIEACPTPLRIVVYDVAARRTEVLATGDLATAIRASCCVPGMFQPVALDGRLYLDGGIADRPGLAAASPDARVLYHHLPSRLRRHGLPSRRALSSIHEPRLPRVGPTRLAHGRDAWRLAREAALRALEAPARR